MEIGENIRKYREQHGLSLTDLAQIIKSKIGKLPNKATLQRYESGDIKNIPYDMVILLAEIFNVTPAQLMGWDTPENPKNDIQELYNKLSPAAQQRAREYFEDLLSNPKNLRNQ